MSNENTYITAMQATLEELMINAGSRISGVELAEIFEAASRTAGWFAEHENEQYYHRIRDETRTLAEWWQYWHEMVGGTRIPFRQWVCVNLERASYDAPLFALTEEDAQIIAHSMNVGEPLTEEQMERVKKGVAAGLKGWQEIMATAIMAAVK